MLKKCLKWQNVLLLVAAHAAGSMLVACDDDEADEPEMEDWEEGGETGNYDRFKSTYDKLFGTVWALQETRLYSSDGSYRYPANFSSCAGETITFSNEKTGGNAYKFYTSLYSGYGLWMITDDGELLMTLSGGSNSATAAQNGMFSVTFGIGGEITTLSSSTLKFKRTFDSGGYYVYTYVRAGSSTGGSGGSGSGSSYEKPDVDFYDYTPYGQTGLKIQYRIYNNNKANVTSAKIYYGTSSPSRSVNATVSSNYITANITGLKAGTTYYVKCTATGSGGSTTTSTTRVSTNY